MSISCKKEKPAETKDWEKEQEIEMYELNQKGLEEENKRNAYFLTLLDDTTISGLYEDFDVWNFKPIKKITKYRHDLDYPIIEIKSNNNLISNLIVHRSYISADSVSITYENNKAIWSKYGKCECNYDFTSKIYFYQDSLIQWSYMASRYHKLPSPAPLIAVSKIYNGKISRLFRYGRFDKAYMSDDSLYIRDVKSISKYSVPPFYTFESIETPLADSSRLQIQFYIRKFDYSSDSSELGMWKRNYENAYQLHDSSRTDPFQGYFYLSPNIIYYPNQKTQLNFIKSKVKYDYSSYFWYLWYTRLADYEGMCDDFCRD